MTRKQLERQTRIIANNVLIIEGLLDLAVKANEAQNMDAWYALRNALIKILGDPNSLNLEFARWFVAHQDEKDWYRQEAKNYYADFMAYTHDEDTEEYYEAKNFTV